MTLSPDSNMSLHVVLIELQERFWFPNRQTNGDKLDCLLTFIRGAVESVAQFANNIPGFHDLPRSDRVLLLRYQAFAIVIMRCALRFNLSNNTLMLENGVFINMQEFVR